MISNPISFFIDGYRQKEFLYEGGTTLYHFSPNDNGLSEYMDTNFIFFADNPEHALKVLERMFKFAIKSLETFLKSNAQNHDDPRKKYLLTKFERYLKAVQEGKVKVQEAPRNQFYKVD